MTSINLTVVDGHPTTTSLDVAAHFGKLHKDVLKRIANLDCSPEFTQRNFAPCTRPGSNNKPEPYYHLTRDGFTFLCMGFTGKEAAKWKEAYINAFNQMEAALVQQAQATTQALPDQTLTPRMQRHIQKLVNRLAQQPGNSHAAVYRSLKDRFMVGKYSQIPADQYPAACRYLGSEPLTGEWLGPDTLPAPDDNGCHVPGEDLHRIRVLCQHFTCVHEVFERYNLYSALKMLGSRAGIEMIDHFIDGQANANSLMQRYQQQADAYYRTVLAGPYERSIR